MTRRHVITGMLVAAVAVVLNCAVAGACAWFAPAKDAWPGTRVDLPEVQARLQALGVPAELAPPGNYHLTGEDQGLGRTETSVHGWFYEDEPRYPRYRVLLVTRVGLPQRWVTGAAGNDQWRALVVRRGQSTVIIPLSFRWAPFIVNCLFYALIAWTLLVGPRQIARRCRLKSGRCPSCRYARTTGSTRCSECGSPVPASRGLVPLQLRVSATAAAILLAVLVGAALTVVSGWCMALTPIASGRAWHDAAVVDFDHDTWWELTWRWSAVRKQIVIKPSFVFRPSDPQEATKLPSWITIDRAILQRQRTHEDSRRYEAVGWPMPILWAEERLHSSRSRPPMRIGAIPLGDRPGAALLPLRPIWPGFAVNTALWALMLLAVVRAPRWLRRFVPRSNRAADG